MIDRFKTSKQITPGFVYHDKATSKFFATAGLPAAWPGAIGDLKAVDSFYETLLKTLCREADLCAHIDWNNFNHVQVSYIDVWLYRNDKLSKEKAGLKCTFSRVLPCFVVTQGENLLYAQTDPSKPLDCDRVDEINSATVDELWHQIEPVLLRAGLVRLRRERLSQTAAINSKFLNSSPPLNDGPPYKLSDLLFHLII